MILDRYDDSKTTGKFSIVENWKGGKITHIKDPTDDFVVLKLKDINTPVALRAYANSAEQTGDLDLADNMRRLALEADNYPGRKMPD